MKITVAIGRKVPKTRVKRMRRKAGSSNAGKYPSVAPKDFAGKAGGASPYSFPINTLNRAKSALKLAHNAPNPAGIKKRVMAKYPSLTKKK